MADASKPSYSSTLQKVTDRPRGKRAAGPIWIPFHTPPHFLDEGAARVLLEATRWPGGPRCPHCFRATVYRMQRRAASTKPGRPGLLRCRACKAQFTVTIGTVFEDSHLPLSTWLRALSLWAASTAGLSAQRLHQALGITYASAWLLAHRLRDAIRGCRRVGLLPRRRTRRRTRRRARKATARTGRGRPGLLTPLGMRFEDLLAALLQLPDRRYTIVWRTGSTPPVPRRARHRRRASLLNRTY
jgi:transposase-like protein